MFPYFSSELNFVDVKTCDICADYNLPETPKTCKIPEILANIDSLITSESLITRGSWEEDFAFRIFKKGENPPKGRLHSGLKY